MIRFLAYINDFVEMIDTKFKNWTQRTLVMIIPSTWAFPFMITFTTRNYILFRWSQPPNKLLSGNINRGQHLGWIWPSIFNVVDVQWEIPIELHSHLRAIGDPMGVRWMWTKYFLFYEIPIKFWAILDVYSQNFDLKFETPWINGNAYQKCIMEITWWKCIVEMHNGNWILEMHNAYWKLHIDIHMQFYL